MQLDAGGRGSGGGCGQERQGVYGQGDRVTPTAPPQSPSHGSVRDHSLSLSPPRNILHSRMSLPPLQGSSPNVRATCLLTCNVKHSSAMCSPRYVRSCSS